MRKNIPIIPVSSVLDPQYSSTGQDHWSVGSIASIGTPCSYFIRNMNICIRGGFKYLIGRLRVKFNILLVHSVWGEKVVINI